MEKENNEPLFKLVVVTEEDRKKEIENIILNLKEEQKTDIIFNNENLYYLGKGHSFGRGFYYEHITKTGIKATKYVGGNWFIGDKEYKYENNEFIDVTPEPIEYKPIDWSNFSFPIVKNIEPTTIADKLKSIQPKWKK